MGRIYSEDLIEEIRSLNDIVDVVSQYVKLERKGTSYFGLCPFHREKTPSFSVSPKKQIFYCFGCGKGGNVIHFMMHIENYEFHEALEYLAKRVKINLPENSISSKDKEKYILRKKFIEINTEAARFYHANLIGSQGKVAREYLFRRGIDEKTIRRFGLGYSVNSWDELCKFLVNKGYDAELLVESGLCIRNKSGKLYDRFRGRIIFPIFDVRGSVIAFGGRVIDSSEPKYLNSPETTLYHKGQELYALNFAKNSGMKDIIIVEGYMDVISLHQRGIINAVASLGVALTEQQGRLLKRYADEVIIGFDSDTAGRGATLRGLDILVKVGMPIKVLDIPEGKDPDEFIRKRGTEEFKIYLKKAMPYFEYKLSMLKQKCDLDSLEGRREFLKSATGIISEMDSRIQRELYISKIASEYGVSKEALMTEMKRQEKRLNTSRTRIKVIQQDRVELEKSKKNEEDKIISLERLLFAILCIDNSIYRRLKGKLDEIEFTDKNIGIAQVIFKKIEDGRGIVAGELLNSLDADEAQQFLKLLGDDINYDDTYRAALDVIDNIENIKLKRRKQQIVSMLEKSDNLIEGDVEKLKVELINIQKRLKGL